MASRANPLAHLVSTLLSEGDVLIFLGAGSSTDGSQDDAPFPDFDALISRVLRDEGLDATSDRMNEFLEVMRRWERESILSVRLASYLYGNPGMSHLQLASVTMGLFPAVNMTIYLTTNFDDLMFKALSAVTKNSPQRDPKAFSLKKTAVSSETTQIFRAIPSYTHKGTPVIVKLFGDLASTSPVFDSLDMPFDALTEQLLIKLLDRTTLFIGYGFHDAPILRLLIRSGSPSPVFVVAPENPIDERLAQISQREFYWLPKTFSEFVAELITAVAARNPSFEATFASLMREANTGFVFNSKWALRECARNASAPVRARYLNRARGNASECDDIFARGVVRSDSGPDIDAFKRSDARILAIIGESGSGKSTLLFQIYERSVGQGDSISLYYDAQSFQGTGSLVARLSLDLAVEHARVSSILRHIGSSLARDNAQLLILVDALNETGSIDPLSIRYELEGLASSTPGNVRFVYSCRRVFWDSRMNPANDLPLELYSDRKLFLLSKFTVAEARIAYEHYRSTFDLRSDYESLSYSAREHIRDPLMLRFLAEAYRSSGFPQFAPAVLVFGEMMAVLRRRYRQTPLIDFLDCMIDQRLELLIAGGNASDIFSYRAVRMDSNLALLAQQQMLGRRHAEHPLTLLEDENIITSAEIVPVTFKFTYERFYEYLIGLRLHYKIFSAEGTPPLTFVATQLDRFREAHYSFYQGLKSAFVMECLGASDAVNCRAIASLARNLDKPTAAFGRDILREVIFESGQDASNTLALLDDGQASTTALVLDLGFEAEGVLPYAIKGLFDRDARIRRRSVHCLMFQARNFGCLETVETMLLAEAKSEAVTKEIFTIGLVYHIPVALGATEDKSTAFCGMRRLLAAMIAERPDRVNLGGVASALKDAVELEAPSFFGVNYGSDGIVYPWNELRANVVPYAPALRALLQDCSLEILNQYLDVILFFSDIRVTPAHGRQETRLFTYQLEYRIVQWSLIRAWTQDAEAVLELLDRIVERGQPFNIDFSLGILEHALFLVSQNNLGLLAHCRTKMLRWIELFEGRFFEFYLSLSEPDPFSFNLAPLAVLARVEARFFVAESGVIPCIASWLSDASQNRRKMALLAANWLAQEFPVKVLTTLESTVYDAGLEDWYDRVLAGFEKHSPRLLDEFFNKMHLPIRRRTNIRTAAVTRDSTEMQYHCESFFSWLFLGHKSRLRTFLAVYDMIYASSSARDFFLRLLQWWIDSSVTVE